MAVLLGPVAQFDEADEGRLFEGDSLLFGDLAERGINVRQVICGDVADEGAREFVVAHAAVQPAEKERELHEARSGSRDQTEPMKWHGSRLELEQRAGERAERAAERRTERAEKAAGTRGAGANAEQFRGNAERAAEEIGV